MSGPEQLAERVAELRQRLGVAVDVEPEESAPDDREARAAARELIASQRWERAIPRRFQSAELEQLDAALGDRLRSWLVTEPRPNLVLTGPVGTGKTYAAAAAVRPLVAAGAGVAFWPVVRLLDHLRPGSEHPDPYAAAAAADLLVLDDLGAERATDWTAERLYALVNDRWLDERPTIATTNLPPPALAQSVGERLASRLLGGATIARLAGHDRRMENP